ncbi:MULTISPECIES: TIGR01212 family radical SAM protein [unclassified Gilliamella]|uniref:TIGR01212 family radical SAM protein n=1 Tax=unclassified Gilliamella TaxID=2685620 RepID=UPI00226A6EE0|nr:MULTISPECIES: TIGR01212 family radical SAM protein [unclassified Gilliamella]MCX8583269.1 TIGR01212 family radical SAM protein [Gilliamella sp. B3372]MCX8593575.1 TIGR01212 family radical SAM protein [Gilliamella sp. B3367]
MQLHLVVNTFGADLQRRYGEKIYKLTLHGGFSCPNRDGTIGVGGCTFCNVASIIDESIQVKTISQQLAQQAHQMKKSKRYLAYFQAYTSTYAEVEILKNMYEEALNNADIVGLCVGTRPDCVPDEALDLLASYHAKGFEVWLELGLQTAHDKTLHSINRGHTFNVYHQTVQKARRLGIKVCTHLIIGLPKETKQDNLITLDSVLNSGVDGLKLHPLHIVEGSIMAKAWRAGRLDVLSLEQYVDIAGDIIRQTPANILYHRISANARKPTLLAPDWCENHWQSMNAVDNNLRQFGAQGSAINETYRFEL